MLNNINSTANINTVSHFQLSLSRYAIKLVHCHCRYHRHCLRLPVLFLDHGFYCSKSCCISHGPSQRERANFDPPQLLEPWSDFAKLEIYNYFPDTTPHAKFQGPMSTWVVWVNSQFDAWKFLSFFSFLSHVHSSHFWTHPNAQYVIMRRSCQGSSFWGLDISCIT